VIHESEIMDHALGGVCIQASHTMVQAIMTKALNEARVFSHLSAMRL